MWAVIWCRKCGRCTDGPLGPLQTAGLATRATRPSDTCVTTEHAIAAAGPVQRTATASLPAGTRRNATGLPTSATSVATGACSTSGAARSKTGHMRGSAASPGRVQLPSSMAEDPGQHTARMEDLGAAAHLAPGRTVQRLLQPLHEVRQLPLPILIAVGLAPGKQLKTAQSTRHQGHNCAQMRMQTHTDRRTCFTHASAGS